MQTQTPEQNTVAEPRQRRSNTPNAPELSSEAPAPASTGSTLIEFPGTGRNRPAWRKELSERVREIQQRRAREAAIENEGTHHSPPESVAETTPDGAGINVKQAAEASSKQLGLVPPPLDSPEPNPIVVAALQRIERARRQSAPPLPRAHAGRATSAATAAARVVEEQYETSIEATPATVMLPRPEALKSPAPDPAKSLPAEVQESVAEATLPEPVRASSLVVVPSKPVAQSEPLANVAKNEAPPASLPAPPANKMAHTSATAAVIAPERETIDAPQAADAQESAAKPQPRRLEGVIDDAWLTRLDAEILPKVASARDAYNDRAPRTKRVAAALTDLLLVAFLSAPFAAAIELTIGNWKDLRVAASMGGIVAVVMFLYLTCSTALAGRTLGMKLFSLHTVDATTALSPTTGQCARRAVVYMLSLAIGGLGILYALFDAEGRAAHDHLSGTVIVKG